jgi:septal ring factor EnvC (AmiA/AmiB activator)
VKPVEIEIMADTKELEAAITAQGAQIKELSEAIKAQKPAEVKVEIPKELSETVGKIKELADSNAALLKRIDALEKDGTPRTGAGAIKELEALPEFYVNVDRKAGTVGGQ